MRTTKINLQNIIIIFLALIIGGLLRFYNLNWDEGHFFHPDERNIANAVARIHFFDQLNPDFFAYGGLIIYLIRAVAETTASLTQNHLWLVEWGHINLIGRFLSAFFSTLTIPFVYLLAKKIFNQRIGIFSAIFYTFTVSSIQIAHFAITENFLTLAAIILCLCSVYLAEKASLKNYLICGIILGLVTAAKTTGLSLIAFPLTAHLINILRQESIVKKNLFFLLLILTGLITFTIFSPYTFLSWDKFVESMRYESGVATGTLPVPYTLQFAKTIPYLFQAQNFLWQIGPLIFLSLPGLILLIIDLVRKRRLILLIFITFPLLYFLYVGSWHTKFIRYTLPLLPFLIILASLLLDKVIRSWRLAGLSLTAIFYLLTVLWACAFFSIYTREQTRITASKWIYQNIPVGSVIYGEHWDDGLPIPLPDLNPNQYQGEALTIYDSDNEAKLSYYAQKLSSGDYIILSSRRLYGTLINLPDKYPLTSRYYQSLFSGQLGYQKVAEFTSYPSFLGIEVNDDASEETFQIYEHPKVIIFKNTSRLPSEQINSILAPFPLSTSTPQILDPPFWRPLPAYFFIVISFVLGWMLVSLLAPLVIQKDFLKFPISFILGTFFLVWLTFLLSLFLTPAISILASFYISVILIILLWHHTQHKFLWRISLSDLSLISLFFIFSWWFVYQSLSSNDGVLKIGANVWSDFEVHLPLIRTFSWGGNIPPQAPSFPHKNFSYHFLFYYWNAILEFLGLSLNWATSLPSLLSLTALLTIIFKFPKYFFPNKATLTGIIAVVLFLFNSTFSFIEAIEKLKAGSLPDLFNKIWNNNQYLSVGPFTDDKVSIIWNLNVYANQPHVVFGFALALIIVLFLFLYHQENHRWQHLLFLGILVGLSPFWHIHLFLSLELVFLVLAVFKQRFSLISLLFIAGLFAIPQLLWLSKDVQSSFAFHPGFLAYPPLSFSSFSTYWLYNLGLLLFAIPLGVWLSKKEQKIWFLAFLSIFIFANLFQIHAEMFNNHKLFNLWLLFANFFAAYFLASLWTRLGYKILFFPLFFILILSGIIDFMVTKNQPFYEITDAPKNTLVSWVKDNTSPNSIFLGYQDEMYHFVRMAGRFTFLFQPRYGRNFGYEMQMRERDQIVKALYQAENPSLTLQLLAQEKIDYVIIPKDRFVSTPFFINYTFFNSHFPTVFDDQNIKILQVN